MSNNGVSPRCGDGLSLPSNRPAEGRGFIPAKKTRAKRATFALALSQQPFAFAVHALVHNPLDQHSERTNTYSIHVTLAPKLKGTAAMQRGWIGWWNCERGFGFIHDKDSDKTYFVHLARIQADGRPARRQVEAQIRVDFDVGPFLVFVVANPLFPRLGEGYDARA